MGLLISYIGPGISYSRKHLVKMCRKIEKDYGGIEMGINYYKGRVCLNVLGGSLKNAAEIYEVNLLGNVPHGLPLGRISAP